MTHDLETTIQLPDEEDVDVLIEFEVTHWGSSGCGPSWNHPGDPPEPPEFDLIKVERDGTDITDIFDTLPGEYRQKIYELVFERVCEIDEDRAYGPDD